MATINPTNFNINFSVGIVGNALYQTIQSAINAAHAAGGGCVFIQPGSYTENLTLFGDVQLQGQTGSSDITGNNSTVTITGIHTPPTSGFVSFDTLYLVSATHIFSSASAGTTVISLSNCVVNCANGYIYSLVNWTGTLSLINVQDVSTSCGVINNTGGSELVIEVSGVGVGTGNSMVSSGVVTMEASAIGCPWSAQTGSNVTCNLNTYTRTVTLANNSTGTFNNCTFSTGATPAVTMSSSGAVSILESVITSSNNPVISGSGAGTLSLGGITFTSGTNLAGTLVLAGAGGFMPGSFGSSGQLLTSNGAGVIPTFQAAPAGGVTTIAGNTGTATGSTITINSTPTTGGKTVTFAASGSTVTLSLSDGSNNVAIGSGAGFSIVSSFNNFYLGLNAGSSNDGSRNVCIGVLAGQSMTTGLGNVIIGDLAGLNYASSETNNILIGRNSRGVVGDNGTIRLGDPGEQSICFIAGIVGVTLSVSAVPVVIDTTGQLGTIVSSARYKDNIKPLDSSAILKANPVQFNYKGHKESDISHGLIAEELNEILPQLVIKDKQGNPETIKYQDLPVFLLSELKKSVARIEELEKRVGV